MAVAAGTGRERQQDCQRRPKESIVDTPDGERDGADRLLALKPSSRARSPRPEVRSPPCIARTRWNRATDLTSAPRIPGPFRLLSISHATAVPAIHGSVTPVRPILRTFPAAFCRIWTIHLTTGKKDEQHHGYVRECIDAGQNVLCEKEILNAPGASNPKTDGPSTMPANIWMMGRGKNLLSLRGPQINSGTPTTTKTCRNRITFRSECNTLYPPQLLRRPRYCLAQRSDEATSTSRHRACCAASLTSFQLNPDIHTGTASPRETSPAIAPNNIRPTGRRVSGVMSLRSAANPRPRRKNGRRKTLSVDLRGGPLTPRFLPPK